jgi:hypothetical protein
MTAGTVREMMAPLGGGVIRRRFLRRPNELVLRPNQIGRRPSPFGARPKGFAGAGARRAQWKSRLIEGTSKSCSFSSRSGTT